MLRNSRAGAVVAGVGAVCVVASLAFAQVKVSDPTNPLKPPDPLKIEKAPQRMPGQLATTPNATDKAKNDSLIDPEAEVNAAGEPIISHVVNIVAPTLVKDQDGNILNNLHIAAGAACAMWRVVVFTRPCVP